MRQDLLHSLTVLLLPGVLGVAGCSHEQVYNAVQDNRRQEECAKLPQGQYEQCMEQYSQPYDEYERQRQEVLREEANPGGGN